MKEYRIPELRGGKDELVDGDLSIQIKGLVDWDTKALQTAVGWIHERFALHM